MNTGSMTPVVAVCMAGLHTLTVSAAPTITIDATAERRTVSPDMYGIFFEEINHAGEGGLYAEMVKNRDMEASVLPKGWHREGDTVYTPLGWKDHNAPQGEVAEDKPFGRRTWKTPVWFDSDLPGWSFIAEGDAEGSMSLDKSQPLNESSPHSLKMTVTKLGDRCGIVNSGFWGMHIEEGEWYDITFYAHAADNRSVGLVFSFERPDGTVYARATLPEVGRVPRPWGQSPAADENPWREYRLSVPGWVTAADCRLIITPIEPVTMWFDVVSVFPRKTFKNRPNGMRADVARILADMKPGFLRFPGGCVVEGATIENRVQWKHSIGDISRRKGNFNLWGYYNINGLGYHEYLQLAEDLGAEAMYVCNVGMSCQARQPAEVCDDDIQAYVQDALDAIEYAVGPITSEWGGGESGPPTDGRSHSNSNISRSAMRTMGLITRSDTVFSTMPSRRGIRTSLPSPTNLWKMPPWRWWTNTTMWIRLVFSPWPITMTMRIAGGPGSTWVSIPSFGEWTAATSSADWPKPCSCSTWRPMPTL